MTRLALLAAVLLQATTAFAAFPDLGAGARAPGMGDAYTAIADDVNAHHYNPAGLSLLARPQFNATYSRLHQGLSDGSEISLSQLSYAHPLRNNRGTLSLAYHSLNLSGLYGERSLYGSWGRRVFDDPDKGALYAGGSLKHLSLSFDKTPEAGNALDLKSATGSADPVLSGDSGKSALDLDLGLLYRYNYRYYMGLAVKHLNEPNVAIASDDTAALSRSIRLALAYRALWLNLASELKLDKAPGGSTDKKFILAAERYFPSLRHGQFGLRGSLGFGSRDFRRLTMGLTYRVSKIQFDYAFLLPMGTIQQTAGTHRLGLTLHFGAPTPEEQYEAELTGKIYSIRTPSAGYAYEFAALPSPLAPVLDNEGYAGLKRAIDAGNYIAARNILAPHLEGETVSVPLVSLGHRLQEVLVFFQTIDTTTGDWAAALHLSIQHFLYGRDKEAVLVASHALSMNQNMKTLDDYLLRLEEVTKLKGERMIAGAIRNLLTLKLNESETLFLSRKFDESRLLCEDILILHPNHAVALARIGSTYYMQKAYKPAIAHWKQALAYEPNSSERETLKFMLLQAEKKDAPIERAVLEQTRAKNKWDAQPKAKPLDPKLIERLYQQSVDAYSAGEWDKAARTLERILVLEPANREARRALRRLEAEKMGRKARP